MKKTLKFLLSLFFILCLTSCEFILTINSNSTSENDSTLLPSASIPITSTPSISIPSVSVSITSSSISTTEDNSLKNGANEFLKALFGENVVVYNTTDKNPYGIDLSSYGDYVKAIFYEPDFITNKDPYENVDVSLFYNKFKIAQTYEEAFYRTQHGLLSGDCSIQSHLPSAKPIIQDNVCVKAKDSLYILSKSGEYIGYMPNSSISERIIYYGAGYSSLNDVAAYLLAFGEVPANSNYGTSNRSKAIDKWGQYGRVNISNFSGDTTKYPYEPLLPTIIYNDFTETDFGSKGGFVCGGRTQTAYNNGSTINRGTCRFVFTSDASVKKINERYVFYTYNHYNDFQEYLNYDNGYGYRFGNESAGNPYCSSGSDYKDTYKSPTPYPNVISHNFTQN